jgi:hypothetical protein
MAGFRFSPRTISSKWSATWPTVLCAMTSGCALAASTVSGSSGQPGVSAVKPASSNTFAQRSQLLGSSQRPWTKTTGGLPVAFAVSTCCFSCSVMVRGWLTGLAGSGLMVILQGLFRFEWLI